MPKVFILNLFFDFIFIQKKKVFVLNKYFDKMSIIIVLKLFLLERIFKYIYIKRKKKKRQSPVKSDGTKLRCLRGLKWKTETKLKKAKQTRYTEDIWTQNFCSLKHSFSLLYITQLLWILWESW